VSNNGTVIKRSTFDKLGRTTLVETLSDDGMTTTSEATTRTSYTSPGQVEAVWDDLTYTRFYSYDEQGRMTELRTYQGLAHGTKPTELTVGAATTGWVYHSSRGWLIEKNYPGESEDGSTDADYSYTAAGRLATRVWERGVTTSYGYDKGTLTSVTYDDTVAGQGHETPDLAYTYDSFGRLDTVKRNNVLHAKYNYDPSDLGLLSEQLNQDTGNPKTLTRTYEDGTNGTVNLRPSGYTFANGSALWTYDNAGRYSTVSDGTDTYTYGYHYSTNAGGNHLGGATSGPQTWMPLSMDGPQVDHVLEYDSTRNALLSRKNTVGANPALSSFTYSVNALGQRETMTPGGSAIDTTTDHSWQYNDKGELDLATRGIGSPFNRSYLYDGIGNRTSSTDNVGTTSYTANALNQYTAVGSLSPVHDLDGNMTSGPVPAAPAANSTLVWDAENRLVKATVGTTTTSYDYDYLSRLVKTTTGSSITHYLYDGWNRIAEYSGATSPSHVSTNLWGLDLSGSLQGAGGVGGLLSVVAAGGTVRYYPSYDGNGNVSEYVNQLGVEVAHFEYDPFGNLTVDDQSNAASFPYRFSTKPQDATTGLYYYGYRYYDPKTGRWPSRDPIGENFATGEFNEYAFILNDGLNKYDVLGLLFGSSPPAVDMIDVTFGADDKFKGNLDEHIKKATKELNSNLKYCCKKFKIACKTVVNPTKSKKRPRRPKGGYGGNNIKNNTSALGGGNNVLFSGPGPVNNRGALGVSGAGWGAVVQQDPAAGVVSHELGHHANYRVKDKKDQYEDPTGRKHDFHHKDPKNLMHAVNDKWGRQKPDKCWCQKIMNLKS